MRSDLTDLELGVLSIVILICFILGAPIAILSILNMGTLTPNITTHREDSPRGDSHDPSQTDRSSNTYPVNQNHPPKPTVEQSILSWSRSGHVSGLRSCPDRARYQAATNSCTNLSPPQDTEANSHQETEPTRSSRLHREEGDVLPNAGPAGVRLLTPVKRSRSDHAGSQRVGKPITHPQSKLIYKARSSERGGTQVRIVPQGSLQLTAFGLSLRSYASVPLRGFAPA